MLRFGLILPIPNLRRTTIVTELPTTTGPSSVVTRSRGFWTKEILDGKGPWAQAGEYRRNIADNMRG